MTRLSLHSRGENPKLSIRLSVGQYCTLGSSAAADYQVRASGIDPVHCRIGCRSSGGYIECLNVDSKVVVNGVAKDRSRLTHGNVLRIGSLEMQVELPGLEIPVRDFGVSFDQEEAPTTKVSEALDMDREPDESTPRNLNEGAANPGPASSQTRVNDPLPRPAESVSPSVDEKPLSSDRFPSPASSTHEELTDRQSRKSKPATRSEAENELDLHPHSSQSTRSVTFEFDSADPSDLDLSQSEIDEMNQTDPKHNVMGNVDLEGELDSEPGLPNEVPAPTPTASQTDTPGHDVVDSADATHDHAEAVLAEGVNTGKHWKWTNTRAISALRRILDADRELKIYQCDIKQITPAKIGEFSLRWFEKQKSVVFLISRLDENELNTLTRNKRWDERIGHPQAVTMFLALSPKRIVNEFFDSIPACVLINEELELLRRSDQLEA